MDTDNEMRIAMFTRLEMNDKIPCLASISESADLRNVSSSTPEDSDSKGANFLTLSRSDFTSDLFKRSMNDLKAVNNTTIETSTAESSSFFSPSSRAASTNSFAITNETETERSEEIAEMDVAIGDSADDAPAEIGYTKPRTVVIQPFQSYKSKLLISNTVLYKAMLNYISFRITPCSLALHCASLFMSSSESGTKRLFGGANRHTGVHDVSSVSYGCCLGCLVETARSSNHKLNTSTIVRSIQSTLINGAMALKMTSGSDVAVLTAGLAAGHVCRGQLVQVSFKDLVGRLHSRHGNSATILGVCISILALATCLAQNASTFEGFESRVKTLLEEADESLSNCISTKGGYIMCDREIASIRAEQRAIQRARCGFAVAGSVSRSEGISLKDQVFLQLCWAMKAAYPIGRHLEASYHSELLKELSSPLSYMQAVLAKCCQFKAVAPASESASAQPPRDPPNEARVHEEREAGIVALSEIKHSLCSDRLGCADDSSTTTFSSRSSVSSASSLSSFAQCETGSTSSFSNVEVFKRLGLHEPRLGGAGGGKKGGGGGGGGGGGADGSGGSGGGKKGGEVNLHFAGINTEFTHLLFS